MLKRLPGFLLEVTRSTIFPRDLANSRRQFVLIFIIRLFFLVGRRLWNDRCPRDAAALSYQTLVSLVPLLFIAMAITGFLNMDFYVEEAIHFVEHNLLPDAAGKASAYIRGTASSIRPGPLGFAGAAGFLVIAMTLFINVEQVVNDIFRCRAHRAILLRIFLSLLLVLAVPGALSYSVYHSGRLLFSTSGAFQILLPAAFLIASLFLCYWLLPHQKIQKSWAAVSALVTGIGMELARWGFTVYAGYVGGTLSYVYGTMAILPLFLVWVYLMWLIFLFGAELNASLHEVKHYDRFS